MAQGRPCKSPIQTPASTRAMVSDALRSGRIALAFQPVVDAGNPHRPAFYEGLARILDPQGRVVPAAQFMDAVEDHDLGRQLDCATLELGLAELRRCPDLRLAVNLSPLSIGCPHWAETLERGLTDDPTAGERLILEITERSAMEMPDQVRRFMAALQVRGLSFALDDFGAGQTSFRHLRDFRFDVVKVDGQFSGNVAGDPDNRALIRALVGLARHFEMFTVAEHVTGTEDAACLADLGVDCLQGFFFGAPALAPPWHAAPLRARA